MAHLVIAQPGLSKETRKWCNRHLIRCGTSTWLSSHPVGCDGTVCVPAGREVLEELSSAIHETVRSRLDEAHGIIMGGAKGDTLEKAVKILRHVKAVSLVSSVVLEAQAHLAAIGRMTPIKVAEETKNPRMALGFDTKSAKDFILGLAKKDMGA